MQEKIYNLVESSKFKNFILGIILINGLTMGLETYESVMDSYGSYFIAFEKIVITIFIIEIILRIYAHRISFFKDGWNLFDLIIVLVSLAPANESFEIFRILRVFRLFRIITVAPQMRKIVTALISIVPGMASIAGLMSILFYISAIIASQLFGEQFPQWFGDLSSSLYTLFQVMTLESWSMGIARPIMEVYPYAWMFFIPFIFIVTFIMINLIVAVVVDVMNNIDDDRIEETSTKEISEIESLRQEILELKDLIKTNIAQK